MSIVKATAIMLDYYRNIQPILTLFGAESYKRKENIFKITLLFF